LYDAVQKGFSRATGEIMAYLGADDLYHAGSFFTAAEIFSRYPAVKWLLGAMTLHDEYGRNIAVGNSRRFNRYDFLSGDYKFIQQESCFWRRSLWEIAGSRVDTTLRYAGDLELWLRFFRHEPLYVIDALIGSFRYRSSAQLSLDGMDKYIAEAERCLAQELATLSAKERRKLFGYQLSKKIIKPLGMFNRVHLSRKLSELFFGKPQKLSFDRSTQQYEFR
jgi:glycosyltransferase involved in cell wall biosynthesis